MNGQQAVHNMWGMPGLTIRTMSQHTSLILYSSRTRRPAVQSLYLKAPSLHVMLWPCNIQRHSCEQADTKGH